MCHPFAYSVIYTRFKKYASDVQTEPSSEGIESIGFNDSKNDYDENHMDELLGEECLGGGSKSVKKKVSLDQSDTVENLKEAELSGSKDKSKSKMTCHTNPRWREVLVRDIKNLVISKCSQKTKDAVESNNDVQNVKSRKEIENEIINETIDYIGEALGGVGSPGILL